MATVHDVTRTSAEEPTEVLEARDRVALVGEVVSGAASSTADAIGDAVSRLPEVAATTRSLLVEANRQIRAGSDEILIVGSALSFGFAMGLLFGGANRLLVAGAMLPAASMGLTILDRANRGWLERPDRA